MKTASVFVNYTSGIAVIMFPPDAENRQLSFTRRDARPVLPWSGVERYTLQANSAVPVEVDADLAAGLDKILADYLAAATRKLHP